MSDSPLDRKAAREAAHWLMRLGSSHATAADISACNKWRAGNVEHERAWQRAQSLTRTFGLIPHDVGMATLRRPSNPSRRVALKAVASVAIASPVAWATWNTAPVVRWRADYRTAAGEQRDWLLADGSRLWLNTASAVDQEYTDTEHKLWLREGEVYMQASANHQPALTIQTKLGEIYPHAASRFTLRLDAQQCLVSVIEGQVDVQPSAAGARSVRLGAMQKAAFDSQTVYPSRSAAAQDPDWVHGTLYTDAMRLDTFAAELSRYRVGVVRCDPSIAAMQISGTFQLNNTDGILRALPTLLPVQVNYRTSYWVTLGPQTVQT